MIFLRGMAGCGEDYELVVHPAHDRTAIPSAARNLWDTAVVTLC
jgi:hypothetical protein